jgi:hypothetical protein
VRGEGERRPFSPASANGSMDKVELLQVQLPVRSKEGGEHFRRNGLFYRGIDSKFRGIDKDVSIMRWADGLIKVANIHPKDAASD